MESGGDRPRRVVVVDDDLWVRRGQAQALATVEGIVMVADVALAEAVGWTDHWDEVDVVLVDAYDDTAGFDRFLGASVVEAIRRRRSQEETLVVVISGRVDDDHLRLRMAEVGADFFYNRDEVRDLARLATVILDPSEQRRVTPGEGWRLAGRGLSTTSCPHRFLRWLHDQGLEDAFRPGVGQEATGLSRRRIMGIRSAAARIGGLRPSPSRLGGGPRRKGDDPTWREVVDFVNGARGRSPE